MRLVTHYVDPGEASEVSSRLREAGVVTEINSVDPHIIKPSKSGTLRFGLWVVFDDQFDDAVQLLENPEHVPKRTITSDKLNEIRSSTEEGPFKSRKRIFENWTTLIFGACLLGLIIYTAIGVINDA